MESLFADIIVDISHEKVDKTFQYIVPESMQSLIKVGAVVQVPFGKGSRLTKGYVTGLGRTPEYDVTKMKEIHAILTGDGQISGEDCLVTLAAWMRDTYGSTMIQALKTVIPIKKKIKAKEKKSVCLLLNQAQAEAQLAIYNKKNQKARSRLLGALMEEREIPYELVTGKLNISAATLRTLEEQGILQCKSVTVYRNPLHQDGMQDYKIRLNEQQQFVADGIWKQWQEGKGLVSLIWGVTGSGKTEVYIELIARTLEKGQQAIVLIPEIALTYQTVMRFYRRFGDRISMIHSRLSAGEKYDQFERAKNGDIDVMIGPRSALFTPFPNLGVIIIDEEHEPTYKSETTPRYHARETAIQRARMEGAKVVLGSATPSLDAYYRAEQGIYDLYRMEQRARSSRLPNVSIADMREELRNGNRSVISTELLKKMEDALSKKQQIMLFLNRRGYSGFISCRSCGHVIMCPHCAVSLSVHNHGRMVCHYCGHQEPKPGRCPKCGSEFISSFGIGTQQVEKVVKDLFPDAKVLRMDMDTTREKDGHEKILSAFAGGEADILIGTQMIVKGHDFPNVTLVGILAADMSLHAEDYRAAERTFQLLTQAAGRAGRGELSGQVVIQTYDPEHYCIQTAARQDYQSFYEEEMGYRLIAGYPPAKRMLSIHGACRDDAHLEMAMEYLKKIIIRVTNGKDIKVIGPTQESVSKIQDIYRRVLYMKGGSIEELIQVKNKLEKYMEANEGYNNVNIQFDMND